MLKMNTKSMFLHLLLPSAFALQLISTPASAESAYVLQGQVVEENESQPQPTVEFTANGGRITYDVDYNSSCSGTYQMDWVFSTNISQFAQDEEFSVNIQCTVCQDVCGFKWNTARGTAGGANNLLGIPGIDDYTYNGNFEQTASDDDVLAYEPSTFSQDKNFKVDVKKTADESGFYLQLGDHRIIYHYAFTEIQRAEVRSNLDIFISNAIYDSGSSEEDIWFELEYHGLNDQGEHIWKLKEYGYNESE